MGTASGSASESGLQDSSSRSQYRSAWQLCTVLDNFIRELAGDLVSVTISGDTIESTFHHPDWVISGEDLANRPTFPHIEKVPSTATTPGRWVDAGDLQAGDILLLRDGRQVEIEDIQIAPARQPVYNFSVAELSCYAVGPMQVLVHNNCTAEGSDITNQIKSVFRGLADGDNPAVGLTARAPGAGNSVASHVAGKRASQWIFTTTDELIAKTRFGANGVVEIDLSKVTSEIIDVSHGIPGMEGSMLSNWAAKYNGVLIKDFITSQALRR